MSGDIMAKHDFCKTASFVVFMLLITTGRSDIVVAPNNSEVQIGGSAYFNCSTSITSQEIHWFHYPIGSQDRRFVYSFNQFYPPYLGRFSLEKNDTTGEYNLVITSVKAEDAGKYECQEKAGSGIKQSAQLIILEKELMCQSNVNVHKVIGPNACGIKPDQLILSCMVQYRGNEAPILQWGLNDSKTPITSGVTHQINGNSVVYNLTMTTDQISNGSFYVCRTTRSTTKISCKSGEVKVVGSNNIHDRLLCTKVSKADENQQPTTAEELTEAETNLKPDEPVDVEKPLVSSRSGEFNDVLKSHTKNLENDANTYTSQQIIGHLEQTIMKHQQNEESNKRKITSLELENKQLQAKVKDLEQRLYPKENIHYKVKPDLAHTIYLSKINKGKPINGIAVLGNEFFVITAGSEDLEVYDSQTFKHEGNRKVKGLANALDITSSKADNCLYIIDCVSAKTGSRIIRIDPMGNELKQWSTDGGNGRLTTNESNVIVCLLDKQLIYEYSPDGGDPIVTVRLSPAAKLNHPWHAIKVTSADFVVSHGAGSDDLHRVCVVDLKGDIKKECTTWETSFFQANGNIKVPICLAEDSERSVIVADRDNNRILLLSSQLKYKRILIDGLKDYPVRLCFDDTQSKLFVAVNKWNSGKKDYKDGHILIFNIK